jgi:raffinose/stachyose/melibiose transport system substrate-binding protein
MKKRVLSLAMVLVMTTGVLAGCGKSEPSPETAGTGTQSGKSKASDTSKATGSVPTEINVFVNNPEDIDAMNAYIKEYKKVRPYVKVNLEALQSDYTKRLKEKISANDIPDVFATPAGGEIKEYTKYLADLSNEPLARAMTDEVRKSMTNKGRVYGFPLKASAFGMVYSKDLFEKNKIPVPTTLTALEAAAQKLQSVGIQPFTTCYKEPWVFKHVFMHFIDATQPDGVEGLVTNFISGKAKLESYPLINDNFFKFIDMTVKYGDIKPLDTDLNAGLAAFANGKAAIMIGQGPWVEEDIVKIKKDTKIGFAGYPVSDKSSDAVIAAGSDQAMRIYKGSPVLKEVLDLFNWLYTSDYGKKWFSDEAKAIPPIKGAPMPKMQMAKDFETYRMNNKIGDLSTNYSSDAFHLKFAEIMQGYISKTYTKDQAIKEIEKAWKKLGAAK